MNPTELKNLSLEITTLLRNERGKTMESANNITLDRILRHCNTLTGRNDGIVDLNDFLYNQVLDLINQGETTRFGHVTQPIHQRVLESLGLTVTLAPRRSGTNFIIRDTRQPIIRQFNNPSVILMRAASSPNFGNSVNATRSLMTKLRTSDHPVVGTPLKDIIDVRCLVGSLHCDHISNHWEGTQRIDYRFGRHFTDYLGVDIDVAPFDLDVIFQRLDAFDRDHGLIFGMRLNHATVKQHKAKDVARTLTRQLIQRDGIYNGIKITAHGDEIVFNALDRARMTEKPEQTIPLRSVA